MKMITKKIVSGLLMSAGNHFSPYRIGTRILMYHRINENTTDPLSVPTTLFEKQMKFLKAQGYKTVNSTDFLSGKANDKSIILTFDDGYRDNYLNAFPIMTELSFSGTVFCIVNELENAPYLSQSNLIEMKKAGFDIGSHTLTHPHLFSLTQKELELEIKESKSKLEKILGHNILSFCYPFGELNDSIVSIVEKSGYLCACSVSSGGNKQIDRFALRRTEILRSDDLETFKRKLSGDFDLLYLFRNYRLDRRANRKSNCQPQVF